MAHLSCPRSLRSIFVAAFSLGMVVHAVENSGDAPCDGPQDIVDWIRANGGFVDPRLEMSTGPDPSWNVRGIFATASISRFETIAVIPWSLIFTGDLCSLVSSIVHETKKGSCSKFWPYIRVLQEYDSSTLPDAWSQEERSMLDGLPSDGRFRWIPHFKNYESICNKSIADPVEKKVVLDVIARYNGVWTPSGEELSQMVPFQDSINHHPDEDRSIIREPIWGKEVRIIVPQHIEKGQQLFHYFGKGTARMFGNYGFIEQLPREWLIPAPGFKVHEFGVEVFDELSYPAAFRKLLSDVDVGVRGPSTRNGDLARAYRKTFVGDLRRALEDANVTFVPLDASDREKRTLLISNENNSITASVYWLDQGREKLALTLEPGETDSLNTFIGHEFRAETVLDSSALGTFVVSSSYEQRWNLRSGHSETSEEL